MEIQNELKTVLRRLKLSGMLPTLPDRLTYARKEKLDYAEFLELVLSDEAERRQDWQGKPIADECGQLAHRL